MLNSAKAPVFLTERGLAAARAERKVRRPANSLQVASAFIREIDVKGAVRETRSSGRILRERRT
jgi:hypothetical protein